MIDPATIDPRQIVLDLVLEYTDGMPRVPGVAAVLGNQFFFAARNHLGRAVGGYVPVHLDGEASPGDPEAGVPARFVLRRLGPGVWKLAPSVVTDDVHAYVTVIDAPEPAPWLPASGVLS